MPQVVDAGRTAVFNCTVRGGQAQGVGVASASFLKDGEPLVQGGRISIHVTQVGSTSACESEGRQPAQRLAPVNSMLGSPPNPQRL